MWKCDWMVDEVAYLHMKNSNYQCSVILTLLSQNSISRNCVASVALDMVARSTLCTAKTIVVYMSRRIISAYHKEEQAKFLYDSCTIDQMYASNGVSLMHGQIHCWSTQ